MKLFLAVVLAFLISSPAFAGNTATFVLSGTVPVLTNVSVAGDGAFDVPVTGRSHLVETEVTVNAAADIFSNSPNSTVTVSAGILTNATPATRGFTNKIRISKLNLGSFKVSGARLTGASHTLGFRNITAEPVTVSLKSADKPLVRGLYSADVIITITPNS